MNYRQAANQKTRDYLSDWKDACHENFYAIDVDFQHSVTFYFEYIGAVFNVESCWNKTRLHDQLSTFGEQLAKEAEPLVAENYYRLNYPRLEKYNGIGQDIEHVQHHPNYEKVGNIIYGSRLLERLSYDGGLLESLLFFFLSGQLGEAGHNCPFACSAGIVRVLQKTNTIKKAPFYIEKLCEPSYTINFTGAQFLTEIQGGSDVGQNATKAFQDEKGQWRILGEKWFCSNANADLILMTARFDEQQSGTKGLGLFLVPKHLEDGSHNHYSLLRLKEKIGTNAMASAEIAFLEAVAYPVGKVEEGFKLVMENVLHISRLCNSICVLGISRRAYYIAKFYAERRIAFGNAIINYPLVKENLAVIKAEDDAAMAATFATIHLQDQFDLAIQSDEKTALLLRLLANLCKYVTALKTVEHVHHAIDMLAGNGAIETFSPLPRLLRDSIVCENWEGTHNTLRMQIARDIEKFNIGQLLIENLKSKLTALDNDQRKQDLTTLLDDLATHYQHYQAATAAVKLFAIKALVDQMCDALLLTSLLIEASHQAQTQQCQNKLHSFDLLLYRTMGKSQNNDYLNLVDRVIA